MKSIIFFNFIMLFLFLQNGQLLSQNLDAQVKKFLDDNEYQWHDMNIPAIDGRTLYNLVVQGKYTRALEIGTSTGRSGIWIAWALSKTGGKLTTIEIDEERYKQALANFKQAGLADFIDARLADAHKLVKELQGPFDFVFADADKDWNINYFKAIDPKLAIGGCYTVHNVTGRRFSFRMQQGSRDYYDFVKNLPNYETTLNDEGNGICISYKKSATAGNSSADKMPDQNEKK